MKTVEEIAAEVAKETPVDMHEEYWIIWFANNVVARVDQERGKAAVGVVRYQPLREPWIHWNGQYPYNNTPLFLSPTIPAGYALVRTPITEEMHIAAIRALLRAPGIDGLPQRMLDAMIQAAGVPKS